LYYIKFEPLDFSHDPLYKIGITTKTVTHRLKQLRVSKEYSVTILKEIKFSQGLDAYNLEQKILDKFKKFIFNTFKCGGCDFMKGGGITEVFTKDILELDAPLFKKELGTPLFKNEKYNIGLSVRHAKCGGCDFMKGEGDRERVEINFKQVGIKWLMPAYVKLKVL